MFPSTHRRIGALLSLCLAVAVTAIAGRSTAGPHEDANAAHARGDYQAELCILQPAAAQGQPWAENNLGRLYAQGNGVTKSDTQAVAWFEKAATQHDPGAELNLGFAYESGLGVPKDLARSAGFYRSAGEGGRSAAWEQLKRFCDSHPSVAPSDCARIPPGTKAAPPIAIQALMQSPMKALGLLVRLALFVAVTVVLIKRISKARTVVKASTPRARSLIRFLVLGSVAATGLIFVPIIGLAFAGPGHIPKGPILAWALVVLAGWTTLLLVRLRRERTVNT